MGDLRWVLLGLGALIIAAVYAWGRGWLTGVERAVGRGIELGREQGRALAARRRAAKAESAQARSETAEPETEPPPPQPAAPGNPDRIVTVRFVPKGKELKSATVILALRAAGLRHGRYGIFHKHEGTNFEEPLFSVANLTEPGSFDLSDLSESTIPGMSFFMILPGTGDPVARFDLMVDTARALARDLNAELHDEKGSSWSIQRERYVREELIEYRHSLDRPA